MAVSVRLDPLLERELVLAAKRPGVGKSRFIVAALERSLGRKNPYELLLEVRSGAREPLPEGRDRVSPTKATIRDTLTARQQASRADWLAYRKARKEGRAWPAAARAKGARCVSP